jgi:GMP synthase (glutamine-hydrolysing)
MRISVLQHAANEGPGEISRWAQERGHSISIHHLYLRDALPDAGAFDFLVVMGGEMNIYQDRDWPWLKAERLFIRAALAEGKPAVGICLGAQLIADALGSRVVQNPVYEIGWFPVDFTAPARDVFRHLPGSTMALHWHGDTFELPAGSIRLGASKACLEQGFVLPGKCLGLQFHFETDAALVREMVEGSSDFSHWPKGDFVQPPETILNNADHYCATTSPLLFHVLDTFSAELREA